VTVALAKGGTEELAYDKLVLAPGIDFISPNSHQPGYTAAADTWNPSVTPHAWTAGPQTVLLQNQLKGMTSKGLFVLTIPKSPYRCPPGPYERACVVADWLMRNRSGCKILVLDQNPAIQAEPVNFGNAFNNRYKSVLTYKTGVVIDRVDSSLKRIETNVGIWDQNTASTLGKVQVLNVIPNQKAGAIVHNAFGTGQPLPLDATGRWASIDPLTYASVGYTDIHIVGDAQASMPPKATPPAPLAAQPKSGTMANSQAKVCADAILRAFSLDLPDPQPTTNSSCYSPISSKDASWLNANYQYNPALGVMQRVDGTPGGAPNPPYNAFGEAEQVSGDHMEAMFIWADNLFADAMK
jgi:NADPH-dependent 2,4-dienoyl-CoA reductase/sulfur reductase-like enzyme